MKKTIDTREGSAYNIWWLAEANLFIRMRVSLC